MRSEDCKHPFSRQHEWTPVTASSHSRHRVNGVGGPDEDGPDSAHSRYADQFHYILLLMRLHEQVRQARIEHGLTQVKLAQLAGVPRTQLRVFEEGGNITMQTFLKIVTHLPNLKMVQAGPLDLELRHADPDTLRNADVAEIREAMAELMEATRRVVTLLDRSMGGRARKSAPADAAAADAGHHGYTAEEIARARELADDAAAALALNDDESAEPEDLL